ncbi:MAG: hypothetical protein F6K18_01375 [Okeania sp. SIO2C2]|nr:hypothetical protein [Okeania sp. SIO2C2]NES78054.1 hypothetical protein [Okeania sp. SIO1H4]NES90682.1 hypothetical protein [Okeania sp. SIO2B9]NET23024.1 hypothetical protein [Okeania sp. SIO1H5]NET80042.1 hypothetical protein [Okeania sp. SIO1F9]NET96506.1 hypothetical protein [Okeania sp. SIO1H2]
MKSKSLQLPQIIVVRSFGIDDFAELTKSNPCKIEALSRTLLKIGI